MKKKTDTPEEIEEPKKKRAWYQPNMLVSTILLIMMIGFLVYGFIWSPTFFW